MASQGADPAAPQSQVIKVAAANQPARVGAYTDVSLTSRAVVSVEAPSDLPPASGSTTLGGIRPVYATDQNTTIVTDAAVKVANAGTLPLPKSPNKWVRGTVDGQRVSRDPYANQGMIGQSFFNNQG